MLKIKRENTEKNSFWKTLYKTYFIYLKKNKNTFHVLVILENLFQNTFYMFREFYLENSVSKI